MGRVEHIHFVGIGGAGMSGIAEVLHNEGYLVTGSDLKDSRVIQHLQSLDVRICIGHDERNVLGADVVVHSSDVAEENIEIIAARQQRIPVIPRAMMLAELMRFRYGIAIAGTHGKTTTTSLVSSLLAEGGLDPSFVIGGKLNSCGTNAQLGKSAYLVAEADESDASFLFLKPMMAVVTNIDADHMETYGDDFDKLRQTFLKFLHHLPFYGCAVVCAEDEEIARILSQIQRPTLTYGFCDGAHYRAMNWVQKGLSSEFMILRPEPHSPLEVQSRCPGRHNVLNTLAAVAIATELGVEDSCIIRALQRFQGVGRRFQVMGERRFAQGTALVIDDYGHHPQEIAATIDAFRGIWPNRRLIHVFQPHRFTRTQALFSKFVEALCVSDELLLLEIYSAGEAPIPEVTSDALAKAIKAHFPRVSLVNQEAQLAEILDVIVQDGDAILMQGAGSVGQYAINLMKNIRETA